MKHATLEQTALRWEVQTWSDLIEERRKAPNMQRNLVTMMRGGPAYATYVFAGSP